MNRRFTKISTLLATVLLSIILIFACGITGPTTGTTDTTTGGGDSSLSIMPTAVFSTSPELAAAASVGSIDFPFAYFFNTGTRADSGILNPEKLSELFMPLFTGLKKPTAEDLNSDIKKSWIGFYMGAPIILNVIDKTADNTDDKYKYAMLFEYWQDINKDKVIDIKADKWVADVYVKSAFNDFSDVKWSLNQSITNPFDYTQHYELKAAGISDDLEFSGSGTFSATSGEYRGAATVAWSKNSTNGKKYIKVEDGYIKYEGTETSGYFNVTKLGITIDVSADNSSKVIENSTVVTKETDSTLTIVKQSTTLNDNKGNPIEVAYTISRIRKDLNGVITLNDTDQGAKTISINADTYAITLGTTDATTINIADLSAADDDATAAKITVNLSKCPTTAMGKSVRVWVVKPENMIYEDSGVHPNVNIARVSEMKGVVSSTYGASFTTAEAVPAGNYVVYAIIDPLGDFPATPSEENVGATTTDDFYAYSIGVYVDGRNGVSTVNMGNITYGEPGWMKFGSTTTDIRPSLDVSITFTSKDSSTYFTNTAIAGKMIQLGLFEVTSMGINWDAPVGFSFIQLASPTIGSTLTGNKLYIDGIVDFKNKKYTVGARLDMDNDQMDSVGDFFYMDTSVDVALKFDNYNNKYFISIPGFVYLSELKTDTVINYSTYTKDGKPLTDSEYYASTGGATINGSVDFTMIDRYQASAWFAILMPLVDGPEEGTNTPPVAFAQVNSTTGAFTFNSIKRFIDGNTNTPYYYNIVAVGYRNFDINYDKLRMPYQDDILAMKMTSYTYDYYDPKTQTTKQATNYTNSPLALTFNTSGSMVGIKWIDNGVFQPDTTVLTSADLKFDISMLYMDATSGDTGTSGGLSIGTGDKPVYVSVGFEDPMNPNYSSTDRPYWLNDTSFGIKIEKEVNGVLTYVTEYWSNFRDSAYNPMYYISFDCSNANLNAVYKFSVSQEMWNPDKNMSVKFTGSVKVTIGEQNYAYIGLKEETAVVFDPNAIDNAEVYLQIPDGDTTYTKSALTGKYAYVELLDQNFVSKYIMKVQIGEFSYTYDGTNSYTYFGTKAIFTDIVKYNYYLRAFIDWNSNITSSMATETTYKTELYPNIFPDAEDIHPNFASWTPIVYMDYEKYTDPNTGYTYPYNMWFSEWVEIPWGGTTVTTMPGGETYFLEIKYDNATGTDLYAYYMVMYSINSQIESGSVLIPNANGAAPEYVNLYNLTSGMTYTVYVYVDTSVGGATMWPDEGEPSFSTTYAPNAANMTVFANAFTPYVDGGTATQPTIQVNYANTYSSEMKVWLKVLNTDMTVYETKEGYITANGTSTSFTLTNNYDGMTDYNVEVYIDANQDYNISTGDKALTGVSYKIASDSSILVDTFFNYTDGGTTSTTIPGGYGLIINYDNSSSSINVNIFFSVTDNDTSMMVYSGFVTALAYSGPTDYSIDLTGIVSEAPANGYQIGAFADVNGLGPDGFSTDTATYSNAYPEVGEPSQMISPFYFTTLNSIAFLNSFMPFNGGGGTGTTPKLLINYTNSTAMSMTVWINVWDGFNNLYESFSTMLPMGSNYTEALLMNYYDSTINYYADVIIDVNQDNTTDAGDKVNYNASGMVGPEWTFTLNEADFIDYTPTAP